MLKNKNTNTRIQVFVKEKREIIKSEKRVAKLRRTVGLERQCCYSYDYNLLAVLEQEELGEVVVEDADALVREGVAEAVLVRVVHPLAHPDHGQRLGILGLVRIGLEGVGLGVYQVLELRGQVGEVAVGGAVLIGACGRKEKNEKLI